MRTTSVGRYLIYGLIDPRNRSLRYIGKTHKRREVRLQEHIQAATEKQSPVYKWIGELLDKGLTPEIFILERVPKEQDWRLAERFHIEKWRSCKDISFPYIHPPQTIKSTTTRIDSAELTNVAAGG
ncbi:MAG: hypothetical protein HQL97_06950 [Magnetococcales bacterium]|nr:hypothetical protein [Magnetococcales bacterium]